MSLLNNTKVLTYAAIAAVVVIGGIYFWNWNKSRKQEEALNTIFRSQWYMEQDSLNKALNGDGEYPGFIEIADEYSGTPTGDLAGYYVGIIYLKQGQTEAGLEQLKSFPIGKNAISMSCLAAMGYAYEELKDFEEAAHTYERAAYTPGDNTFTTPYFLMQAARNLESAGKPEEALKMYQDIRRKYPLSEEGRSAEKYIARLGGEPEGE